jgi:hypothetical protein
LKQTGFSSRSVSAQSKKYAPTSGQVAKFWRHGTRRSSDGIWMWPPPPPIYSVVGPVLYAEQCVSTLSLPAFGTGYAKSLRQLNKEFCSDFVISLLLLYCQNYHFSNLWIWKRLKLLFQFLLSNWVKLFNLRNPRKWCR